MLHTFISSYLSKGYLRKKHKGKKNSWSGDVTGIIWSTGWQYSTAFRHSSQPIMSVCGRLWHWNIRAAEHRWTLFISYFLFFFIFCVVWLRGCAHLRTAHAMKLTPTCTHSHTHCALVAGSSWCSPVIGWLRGGCSWSGLQLVSPPPRTHPHAEYL